MAFEHTNSKGNKYYLHAREAKNGQRLFFFSKDSNDAIDKPSEYRVIENSKTGLPMLKKK
jgi:hypothetical protein